MVPNGVLALFFVHGQCLAAYSSVHSACLSVIKIKIKNFLDGNLQFTVIMEYDDDKLRWEPK